MDRAGWKPSCAVKVQLIERGGGLDMGDADEMPCGGVIADERVVVDVPPLGLADGRVEHELERSDLQMARHVAAP